MERDSSRAFRWVLIAAVIALTFAGATALGARNRAQEEAAVARERQQQERSQAQQAQATPSVIATSAPAPAAQVTAPAEGQVPASSEPIDPLNPKRGPGAVLGFDAATAPVVPAGGTAADYVTEYYGRLMQRDYETASAMVPKESAGQTVADFLVLLAGYEPEGFFVTDVTDNAGGQTVTALQFGTDNRSWTTTWEFVDTARGRALKTVKYALPDGGACH